jgi:uncharacterized protein (DUF362 family)
MAENPAPTGTQVAMVRARDGLEAVNRAIELAGGLDFIQAGQKVLLKPAMNSANGFPATTDPAVVALVADLCWKRGASRVIVADKPFFLKSAEVIFEHSGIGPAARKAGADVMPLDDVEWQEIHNPQATHWKGSFAVPAMLSEIDHIIYLPTVRTHFMARFTMSLKNSVGLLGRWNCFVMHVSQSLPEHIAEINLGVRPSFYLLDGRKVFVQGGPDNGEVRETGIVFAGKDPVACDALGLALLKTLGTRDDIQNLSVWQQRMLRRAIELRLGVDGPDKIQMKAEGIDEAEKIIQNLA